MTVWLICLPVLVVVVMIEHGGFGADAAAPAGSPTA